MAEAAIITTATAGVNLLCTVKPELWALLKKIVSSQNVVEIVEALKVSVGVLQSKRKDYENEVEARKTKVPSETYKQWIFRVNEIEDELKKLVSKSDKQRKKSWMFSSSQSVLIKQLQKMGEQVGNLLQEGDQLNGKLFADPKLETVVRNNEVPEIRKFETLRKPLEQVLDLLKNSEVSRIGMCGTVGIGKTVIMWNLNNHEEVVDMFDIVIWVKASTKESKENLSREDLQQAIVQRLKIEVEGTSNAEEVAERISMVLKGTKYLILLDDVKEDIDLNRVGIPDSKNGSKLVMTSWLLHVCSSMADRVIKVKYLSIDEAWEMFQYVLHHPRLVNNIKIEHYVWRVCGECNGLPLLIQTVANTFKMKSNEVLWSDGLSSWRAWPERDCQSIKKIYKLLRFYYDDLDDDGRKKCFLYCALYPEDSEICTDYLLECWAAENLLGNDCDGTKNHVRMGHLILSHLKSVSILEEGMDENHVTMDKIRRLVALDILEDNHKCKCLVKTNRALQAPPDADSWKEKNRISLGDSRLNWLPDSPSCNELSTLFLQKNPDLKLIPELFFTNMPNLRVLDLSDTGISSLPPSLAILTNLKVLNLNNCKLLLELPPCIGELVHLEALDLRGSRVNNIPPHIENLTRLRCLRVAFNSENENKEEVDFNYGLISRLSGLEELMIDVESLEQWSNEVVENIIEEVATLEKFKSLKVCFSNKVVIDVIEVAPTTLRIRVPDVSILRSYMERSSWTNVHSISSFQFFIGCQNSDHPQLPKHFRYEKYVKYSNGVGSKFPIPEVLDEVDAIELVNHKEIKQLSDFGIASMSKVQGCLVESCDAIETIMGTTDNALLPNLEHLYLKNLLNLENIWRGSVVPESLSKLKTLVLVDIPNLRSICGIESLEWPSLEKLQIIGCPSLCELPFNNNNAKNLKVVIAEQHWWEALQWQNQETRERITNLCTLG